MVCQPSSFYATKGMNILTSSATIFHFNAVAKSGSISSGSYALMSSICRSYKSLNAGEIKVEDVMIVPCSRCSAQLSHPASGGFTKFIIFPRGYVLPL